MKILVKKLNPNVNIPTIISKGDWIDLQLAEDVTLEAPQSGTLKQVTNEHGVHSKVRNVELPVTLLPLGIAMKLPKGYEAIIASRSSTPLKHGIIMANSIGVIDETYCGNKDEWKYSAVALKHTTITKGTRICQFRIQLSQKATIWQKIKWLFSNKIKIKEVDNLSLINRGGYGSTGN